MPRAPKSVNESHGGGSHQVAPMPATGHDQPVPNALARLVRETMDVRGITAGQVAKRGGLDRSVVYDVLNRREPYKQTPHPETLSGLAKGLDLPLRVVHQAAVEAAGLVMQRERIDGEDLVLAALSDVPRGKREAAIRGALEVLKAYGG